MRKMFGAHLESGETSWGTSSFYHRRTEHVVLMESSQIVKVEHPPPPPSSPLLAPSAQRPLPSLVSSHYRGGGGEEGAACATVAARTFCAALHAGVDGPGEPAALTCEKTPPRSRSHGLLRIWIGANGHRRIFTRDAAVASALRSVRATR